MPEGRVDLVDETFVRATPREVRAALDAAGLPGAGWPDGRVVVTEDRGAKGTRWRSEGAITGRMEIWLEPVTGGTLVHHYVQGDVSTRLRPVARVGRRHSRTWKSLVHALKDEIEGR